MLYSVSYYPGIKSTFVRSLAVDCVNPGDDVKTWWSHRQKATRNGPVLHKKIQLFMKVLAPKIIIKFRVYNERFKLVIINFFTKKLK